MSRTDASGHESGTPRLSVDDESVHLARVSWAQYAGLVKSRGEAQHPKMFYLDGALELMSPSTYHEQIKKTLARLIEMYATEHDIALYGYGSWTLKNKLKRVGLEPDECYNIGHEAEDIPDFAIEVVWTSGGLDKLDLYQRLGVTEVWQWKDGQIRIFNLARSGYREVRQSRYLPELDPAVLCKLLTLPQPKAVRVWRDMMRAGRK